MPTIKRPGTAASARAAAAKAKTRTIASRYGRPREELSEADPTEPDDIEWWLSGELRDWMLECTAETFDLLVQVLDSEIASARAARERLKNDLRAEGYEEGRINAFETVRSRCEQAAEARRKKIGGKVR